MTAPASSLRAGELLVFALLVVTASLTFVPSLNSQFTLPKLALFYPAVCVAALMWIRRYRSGETVALPQSIAIAATGLLVWWIVALPFAVDLSTALWGAPGRGNGLLLHVALLGLFAGLASLRISTNDARRLLMVMMAVMAVTSGYAILQAAGLDLFQWPNVRPGSTIGHPVPLAAILALGLPIGAALTASARTRATLLALGIATAFVLVALGTTLSRGPWIGAAFGIAATVAMLVRANRAGRLKTLVIAAALIAAVTAIGLWGRVPGTRVSQRVALIARAATDPSFMNRFEYFSAALAMIRARPVTGSGFETFGLLFPPLRPVESDTVDEDTIPTRVHNGYLDKAVWTGVPGLLLYLALMIAVAAALLQTIREDQDGGRRALACGVLGGLIAYWIQDLSGWQEISSAVFFWAAAGLGVALCTPVVDPIRIATAGARTKSRITAIAVAVYAVVLAGCTWTIWREAYADARLAEVQRAGFGERWRESRLLLADVRPVAAHSTAYLDRIGVAYLNRLRAAPDADAYQAARDVLSDAAAGNPFDPYVLIHLVDAQTLALVSGLTRTVSRDAVDASLRAVELDPNNATVHETLARFHLAAGHPRPALTEIHAARALRPRRSGLALLEGDILRANGDKPAAVDAYRAELALHAGVDAIWIAAQQKVTAALIEAGNSDAAVREAATLTARVPSDPLSKQLLDAARAMRTH